MNWAVVAVGRTSKVFVTPEARAAVPPLIVRPLLPTESVKYCRPPKASVPSPAFTMPLVVFTIAALRARVVAPPTTWRSIVMPPLVSVRAVRPVLPGRARMPPTLTVRADGTPAAWPRLPPESSVIVFIRTSPVRPWAVETPTFWVVVPLLRRPTLVTFESSSVAGSSGRRPLAPLVTKPVPRPVIEVSARMSGRIEIVVVPAAPPPCVPV